MPNYITAVNQMIRSAVLKVPGICMYGQNINNGTFISGLTKNLAAPADGVILNVSNSENTLCGMGFGMMLSGVSAIYFVKQLDFMLLGLDHFVNTYNFIRCYYDLNKLGRFSIIMLVCDQGRQGPQSSCNSYGDFCSIARIPCYTVTNDQDTPRILESQLTAPGFRMMALSSRLCRTEFLQLQTVLAAPDCSVFQYTEGRDVTIACFNFALPEGYRLVRELAAAGLQASLFSVNYVPNIDWAPVVRNAGVTRRLVVIDDSKSVHLAGHGLVEAAVRAVPGCRHHVVARGANVDFGMCQDNLPIDFAALVSRVQQWC